MLKRHFARAIIVGLAAIGLLIVASVWIEFTTVHQGAALTPAESEIDGLPDEATDIHWSLPHVFGPYTIYDFAAPQRSFEEWASASRFDYLEGPTTGRGSIVVYDPQSDSSDYQWFENAIVYRWSEEDRGITLLYDLDGKRAYYFSHSR